MHSKQDGHQGRPTPNYNVQIATQNQYVTNYDVFDCPDDQSNLLEIVDNCTEENAVKSQAVVADAGYGSEEVYVGLEERRIEAVVKYKYYDRDCARQRRPAKEWVFDSTSFRLDEKGEGFVLFNQSKNIVRKSVVASPWDIGKVFIYDYRDDVGFLLEYGGGVDGEGSSRLNTGKVFDGSKVEIRL